MNIIKDSFKVIIISSVISLSALFVFAQTGWFEPSVQPPGDNRPAPLTLDSEGNLNIPGSITANNKITANEYYVNQTPFTDLSDLDGDGYTPKQGDCNDDDASIKPGGALQFDTGKDNDCNGVNEFIKYLYDPDVPDKAYSGAQTATAYCQNSNSKSVAVQRAMQFKQDNGSWIGDYCLLSGRTIICLANTWGGTSGNTGSCGGHGECAALECIAYSEYDPDECLGYREPRWTIWCN